MSDWLSSVIGAGSSLIGAGLQQSYARSNMQRQHQYSKDLLKYQWDNYYPSTVNALKRAGLNVGLMYSNGGPSVSGSTGSTTAPQIGNPLSGVGELINQSKLAQANIDKLNAETRGQEIDNDNKQRMYDDKHWESVADIDLIRDTISDRAEQREIARSQLFLERQKFDFSSYIQAEQNEREWMECYRRESIFMLDAAKKSFENAHLQEQYNVQLRNMNAHTSQLLASAKSMVDGLKMREKELSLQEREMVADISARYAELDALNQRVEKELEFRNKELSARNENFDKELEYKYANAALNFANGLTSKAMDTFTKFMPTKTTTQTTRRGGTTITETTQSR